MATNSTYANSPSLSASTGVLADHSSMDTTQTSAAPLLLFKPLRPLFLLLASDFVVSTTLYFTAGLTTELPSYVDYLKASVTSFTFSASLFDVFIIAVLRVLTIFNTFRNTKYLRVGFWRHIAIFITIVSILYTLVKFGVAFMGKFQEVPVHPAFVHASLYVSLLASLAEIMYTLRSRYYIRRIRTYQVLSRTSSEDLESPRIAAINGDAHTGTAADATPDQRSKHKKPIPFKWFYQQIQPDIALLSVGIFALFLGQLTQLLMPYYFGMVRGTRA
jgi:hypothetical protein